MKSAAQTMARFGVPNGLEAGGEAAAPKQTHAQVAARMVRRTAAA